VVTSDGGDSVAAVVSGSGGAAMAVMGDGGDAVAMVVIKSATAEVVSGGGRKWWVMIARLGGDEHSGRHCERRRAVGSYCGCAGCGHSVTQCDAL
jgi:hypothetical protein